MIRELGYDQEGPIPLIDKAAALTDLDNNEELFFSILDTFIRVNIDKNCEKVALELRFEYHGHAVDCLHGMIANATFVHANYAKIQSKALKIALEGKDHDKIA